jgi:hypothetical protein
LQNWVHGNAEIAAWDLDVGWDSNEKRRESERGER